MWKLLDYRSNQGLSLISYRRHPDTVVLALGIVELEVGIQIHVMHLVSEVIYAMGIAEDFGQVHALHI